MHQPFKRIIGLRPAEAAVEPGRRFVGQDNAVANFDVADVVGAGQIAMHAVERGRLRRAQMRAAILKLVEGERGDAAVGIDGGLERRHAIGGRHRGAQMLQPILDPFHRPVGDTRGDRDQDDVRKDRLLDAKAAAGIRRRPQPQPVARDLERPRHDRMQAERPLEIGEHVIGALARVVFGNDAVGLDRGAGIPRIAHVDANAVRGFRKLLFRLAVAKRPLADDIAADGRMQDRRIQRSGSDGIHNGRQLAIAHLDQFEGVFGAIAVGGHDHGDRLADIAHPVDRDRPALEWRLHADDET